MMRYVFDSYAMLAYYWREPGASRVHQLVTNPSHERLMTVVNVTEVFYRVAREEDLKAARNSVEWIRKLRVDIIDADLDLAIGAAHIKAEYSLSLADCFAAALAERLDAVVVTGDKEFEPLEEDGIVSIEWLPAKPRRRR